MENKLIKINLNQTLNRFELAEIKEDRKRWVVFGIIAIFIIFIISFNYLISSLNKDLIELKLDEVNRLNTETLTIQQEYNKQREIRENLGSDETLLTSFSFENLEEGYVEIKLPCNHAFHLKCITNYYEVTYPSLKCPLCRRRI